MKYLTILIPIILNSCLSYQQQYDYCLTDPDIKHRASIEGVSVETYCRELLEVER